MRKKHFAAIMLVGSVFLFAGCFGKKEQQTNQPPSQSGAKEQQQKNNAANSEQASSLEKAAPKNTNDLPTAIDETNKDLQMIDSDLKEINNLNMDEGSSNLE